MAADPNTAAAVDEVFNFDLTDDDDPFNDKSTSKPIRDDKANLSPGGMKRRADDNDKENSALGLDQEVQIKKRRKPIAKLDEQRLLSQNGIPKLRALMRSSSLAKKLRLKGKGHEFSDTAKLLNYFQLWLDNLYPRAKFADGLQVIEKAGHSKRMNTMRRAWIDEGKPEYLRDPGLKRVLDGKQDEDEDNVFGTFAENVGDNGGKHDDDKGDDDQAMFIPDSNAINVANEGDDFSAGDDELEALLAVSKEANANAAESEGEDDLDALLAEQAVKRNTSLQHGRDEDEDDLDALLAEQAVRHKPLEVAKSGYRGPFEDDDEDEDALDALLAEQESRKEVELPAVPKAVKSPAEEMAKEDSQENMPSSPIPDIREDDLDALLEEQEVQNQRQKGSLHDAEGEMEDNMLSSSPMPN